MAVNISRDKILIIINWCEKKFGKSNNRNSKLKLSVFKSKGNSIFKEHKKIYGTFQDDRISIYLGSHRDIKQVCATVIHEYTHYLLDDDEYEQFAKMLNRGCYNEFDMSSFHPHEILAKKRERIYMNECYNELKHILESNS